MSYSEVESIRLNAFFFEIDSKENLLLMADLEKWEQGWTIQVVNSTYAKEQVHYLAGPSSQHIFIIVFLKIIQTKKSLF
jgi:gamma-glutamyltranspeptidase